MIFKNSKHQPIKFRGFKFIGYHEDYPIAYYYKELPRGNYELMECVLEGEKKPEIGPGSSVKIIDPFMTTYLSTEGADKLTTHQLVKNTLEQCFSDLEEKDFNDMLTKFTSKVPKEVTSSKLYRQYKDEGYKVLYCSNDESTARLFGIVNIVLYKEENLSINSKTLKLDRNYVLFKPLRFSVSPAYLKDKTKKKYIETDLNEIRIDRNLLV